MVLDPLAALSTCFTYFLQISFVYLVIWGLSSLARSPRVRVRMWGGFLFVTVAYWIWFCASGIASPPAQTNAPAPDSVATPALGWTFAVPQLHVPHLSGLPTWLAIGYLTLLVVLLLQLAVKAWSLRLFLRTGRQPSADLSRLFEDLCDELTISGCELSLVPGLRSPSTARWWHPRVLLPAELVPELDFSQLANILRHELVHIRRRDYLWDRLAALACRVVFFHPVMWMAHRRLRWERELACDEAVVRQCDEQRLQYAECLTTLARWWFVVERNSRGAIGFASSASLLGTRVRALLHEPVRYNPFQRLARAGLVVLVLAMTVASLPGMRLTLYWSMPESPFTSESQVPARSPRAQTRRNEVRQQKAILETAPKVATHDVAEVSSSSAMHVTPSALAAIDRPVMPVFSGETNTSAPTNDYSISDRHATTSPSSAGVWNESGPSAPPRAKKARSWSETAVGAIATGVAVIRSRGGVGGGSGAPSGGSGEDERSDHLLAAPRPY